MYDNNSHPAVATSIESVQESEPVATGLRARILVLTRRARHNGLTINEGERLIGDHKARSVSTRFSELVKRGDIVRVFIGYGRPTRRYPKGVPRYMTRYDDETRRNVVIHWVPEFAPRTVADDHKTKAAGAR